jgi:hypothetical protein
MLRQVPLSALTERLSNICSASHLLRGAQAEGRALALTPADDEEFHALCSNHPRIARDYLPGRLHDRGNSTDLVWWTVPEDIAGQSADEIVDALALDPARYRPCIWLVEVEVPRDDAKPCAVPTVLDAGRHSWFKPSPADELCGRTAPPRGHGPGAREWVGRPAATANATVRGRGHVDNSHGGDP